MTSNDTATLREAIALATASATAGGGPFGAVIVRHGEIISHGQNSVTHDSDPTAHAEINAIRAAARRLGRPHLDDCTLYASCEPCPMCLAASLWAHIPRIIYAASHEQASHAGFDDTPIARILYGQTMPAHRERLLQIPMVESSQPFDAWLANPDRRPY